MGSPEKSGQSSGSENGTDKLNAQKDIEQATSLLSETSAQLRALEEELANTTDVAARRELEPLIRRGRQVVAALDAEIQKEQMKGELAARRKPEAGDPTRFETIAHANLSNIARSPEESEKLPVAELDALSNALEKKRAERDRVDKQTLDDNGERFIVLQVVSELIKSPTLFSPEDFDESINTLIQKYLPQGIDKRAVDVEKINLLVKKELLELRRKEYEGNIEENAAKDVASKVLERVEENFRKHKYANEDLQIVFNDILSEIERELTQRKLGVSKEDIIQILSIVVEEWSANSTRAEETRKMITYARGGLSQESSKALVGELTVDQFFEKIQDIKNAPLGSSESKVRIHEKLKVDLNFGLINVGVEMSVVDLVRALYDLFKKWVNRRGAK